MIPAHLFEIARNMYGAGEGAAHGSAVYSALYGALWHDAWQSALHAGQTVRNNGGTDAEIEAAWRDAFADGLGWSHEEMDAFWNDPNYKFTSDDALKFDESWDAFFEMVKGLGGGK